MNIVHLMGGGLRPDEGEGEAPWDTPGREGEGRKKEGRGGEEEGGEEKKDKEEGRGRRRRREGR